MAGFYPHIGSITRDFTTLPLIEGTGVLNAIVTDIGAGVNGWTIYDDMRNQTGSMPIYYAFANGVFKQDTTTRTFAWTSTSGSSNIYGYQPYGFNPAYAIVMDPGRQDISFDGTNWYTAYYSAWPNNYVSATLDRNFAQASTQTQYLQMRSKSYLVLKCSSSIKDFYVQISAMNSPTLLYTRVWESWNSATHVGTNGGQTEILRGYAEMIGNSTVQHRAIFFFYPDACLIWWGGVHGSGSWAQSMMYAGNLDTTGIRAADTGALWAGWSDTSYSGFSQTGGNVWATMWQFWGGSQCLRTLNGETWSDATGFHTWNKTTHTNCYQFVPRGKTYIHNIFNPGVDRASRVLFCDVDIYQGGITSDGTTCGLFNAHEGRRGVLRYLKVPITNPMDMDYCVFGPAQDGNSYIMIRTIMNWGGIPGPNAPGWTNLDFGHSSNYSPSSFSLPPVACGVSGVGQSAGIAATANGVMFRYFLMPLL